MVQFVTFGSPLAVHATQDPGLRSEGEAVFLKRVWAAGCQANNRLTTLLWCAGWTIPLAVLGFAISIPFWQAVLAESEQVMVQQIDYEDGALCARFGFASGSDKYLSCKLDLLDLRRRHEVLSAGRSIP
jgi:hypothetical protein